MQLDLKGAGFGRGCQVARPAGHESGCAEPSRLESIVKLSIIDGSAQPDMTARTILACPQVLTISGHARLPKMGGGIPSLPAR
jgi:hypothetical protein